MEIDRDQLERILNLAKEAHDLNRQAVRSPETSGILPEEFEQVESEFVQEEHDIRHLERRIELDKLEEEQVLYRRRVAVGYLAVGNSVWDLCQQFITDSQVHNIIGDIAEIALPPDELESLQKDYHAIGVSLESEANKPIYG